MVRIGTILYYDASLGERRDLLLVELGQSSSLKRFYIKVKVFRRCESIKFIRSYNLTSQNLDALSDECLAIICLKRLYKNFSKPEGSFSLDYRDLDMSKKLYFLIISRSILQFDLGTSRKSNNADTPIHDLDRVEFTYKSYIERSIVLSNILEFSKSMNYISSNKDFRKKMIQMIILLIKDGEILQEIKKRSGINEVSTIVFWKLDIIYNSSLMDKMEVMALPEPPSTYNQFSFGQTFYSFDAIIKKSIHQEVLNRIDTAPISRLLSIRYRLRVLPDDFTQILIFFKINSKISDSLISTLYHEFRDEMLDSMKGIMSRTRSNSSCTNKDSRYNRGSYLYYIRSKKKLSRIMSNYTSLLNLASFYKLYLLFGSSQFSFPMFKDFRGRNYSYCSSHPVYNRITRNFLSFDSNLDVDSIRLSIYYRTLVNSIDASPSLTKDFSSFYAKTMSCSLEKDVFNYFLCILFIELFKFYKPKYIDLGPLPLSNVIQLGIKEWDNGLIDLTKSFNKIDEHIYFHKICSALKGFTGSGVLPNMTIVRDSIASFIQHWSYLLGAKDASVLQLLNLSGLDLYDFYIFIKKEVRLIISSCSPDLLPVYDEFVTRSVVKKPVMTSNYNVTKGRS